MPSASAVDVSNLSGIFDLKALSVYNVVNVRRYAANSFDTRAHTQTIDSTWWQVKHSLPETNSQHDGGLLLMFNEVGSV